MEKGNEIVVKERVNGKNTPGYVDMVNLIGVEGSMINLLFSIKKYLNVLTPLELQYYKHVKLAHDRRDNSTTIEDVNELYKILLRVRNS